MAQLLHYLVGIGDFGETVVVLVDSTVRVCLLLLSTRGECEGYSRIENRVIVLPVVEYGMSRVSSPILLQV